MVSRARAVAHANIALAKYWGKAHRARNLTAVPSLSLTLEALRTVTSVEFDPSLEHDELVLDEQAAEGRPLERVTALLDAVRALGGTSASARVISKNEFPTAAGLASSASGFAALALAATRASGVELPLERVSSLARAASASASRSLFGGFVALLAGAEQAERVAAKDHWPLVMCIALTETGPKGVGSTDGMNHTELTSPYYPAWVQAAPKLYDEVRRAVEHRDLERLGVAMEQSTMMMHASMLAARPALIYWSPATISVVKRVRELRAKGVAAYLTMDAGPHVKVVASPSDGDAIEQYLMDTPGVQRVIQSRPGPDAFLLEG
jgi:diphosphomevalonate decarboxylase